MIIHRTNALVCHEYEQIEINDLVRQCRELILAKQQFAVSIDDDGKATLSTPEINGLIREVSAA